MAPLPSRRLVLGACAGGLATAGVLLPRLALAAPPSEQRLVVILLRGGLDGLAAVVPYADPAYRGLRGALALPPPGGTGGVSDLDGRFGLNPGLEPLAPLFRAGELAAFHAVASPYRERSHFDAQNLLENGTDRPFKVQDGWLNRALSLFDTGERRYGLAVGPQVPLLMQGRAPVAAWSPGREGVEDAQLFARLGALYARDPLFQAAFAAGLDSREMVREAMAGEDPEAGLGRRLNGLDRIADTVARLLLEPQGARVAAIDVGGWDTHANQGTSEGQLANRLGEMARFIAGLKDGLGAVWSRTAVLVTTEFGRTARPNGTGGTDHGTAGVALLAGGQLDRLGGGRVVTDWPGLDRLHEDRDLAPTLDLRGILKAVLADHLGLPAADLASRVLPGSPPPPRL